MYIWSYINMHIFYYINIALAPGCDGRGSVGRAPWEDVYWKNALRVDPILIYSSYLWIDLYSCPCPLGGSDLFLYLVATYSLICIPVHVPAYVDDAVSRVESDLFLYLVATYELIYIPVHVPLGRRRGFARGIRSFLVSTSYLSIDLFSYLVATY